MELEASLPERESKSPHRTKKRKHADAEERASRKKKKIRKKKRKHLDANLADSSPRTTSKSEASPPPLHVDLQSPPPTPPPPSSSPGPGSLLDGENDVSIVDAGPGTDDSGSATSSPFYSTTLSLYLALPAIALSPVTALPSLLTSRLAPLLLTYYPPVRGVILSVTDPVLSPQKPRPDHPPQRPLTANGADPAPQLVLAQCADSDGLSYVWLTATFLIFRPQTGDELEGWLNVCSEGFVGLICYNYFQVAVGRNRIPGRWRWVPPGGEADVERGTKKKKKKKKKSKRQDDEEEKEEEAISQETLVNGDDEVDEDKDEERESGHFRREDGSTVRGSIRFRVVDCEIVPGHDRESWSLQIEGTLLTVEEEESVLEEERQKALRRQGRALSSGGLGSRDGSGSQHY